MNKLYPANVRRITAKFNWDSTGVFLAALLFFGETLAVILAGVSLASEGYDLGRMAALTGAAVLTLYVPLAIWKGKLPFAIPSEYEKRRTYAQATLGVDIPRSGDKMKDGLTLGAAQIHIEDTTDASIRAAVGRAYSLGDEAVQLLCSQRWNKDTTQKILLARFQLVQPVAHFVAITAPPEMLDQSQEQGQQPFIARPATVSDATS